MIFDTYISGIPCQCEVLSYSPSVPMRVTGSGIGDADEPEDEDIEFQILDRKGYNAPWLASKVTNQDSLRLLNEFHAFFGIKHH